MRVKPGHLMEESCKDKTRLTKPPEHPSRPLRVYAASKAHDAWNFCTTFEPSPRASPCAVFGDDYRGCRISSNTVSQQISR